MMKRAETACGREEEDKALRTITASEQETTDRKRHRTMLYNYEEKLFLKGKSL